LQTLTLGFRPWGPISLHRSSLPVNRSSLASNLWLCMLNHSPLHQLGLCSPIKYLPDCYLNIGIALAWLFGFTETTVQDSDGRGDTCACRRSLLPRHRC